MARKLSDDLKQGDPVAVALRGGAGWVSGTIVWIDEASMLVRHSGGSLGQETPFVLVDLSQVAGIALPREIEPPSKPLRSPGFGR